MITDLYVSVSFVTAHIAGMVLDFNMISLNVEFY